jgi:hypothetical protein
MRYYIPILRLSGELPPQSSPQDKLGGLPWGLRQTLWPKCTECGKSQSLLAQFVHDNARLDLGRSGRVLSVFQCNHDPGMCPTWEGGSGANACIVTEPNDLIAGLTPLPCDSPLVEREARVVEWLERDDGITEAQAAHFFSEAEFFKLPASEMAKVTTSTRLGGVPHWIQSPDEASKDGWRFIAQLDSTYSFLLRAPTISVSGVTEDSEHWEGRSHYCQGPNLGDGGIAYLFLRNTSTAPEGWFFWQCG